jgi:hypothetical protein
MATIDSAKKHQELWFVNKVRLLYPAFPVGELVSHEEPDFLIGREGEKLGIEMTLFIRGEGQHGSVLRQYEATQKRLADMAKKEFEQTSSIALCVHLHWLRSQPRRAEAVTIASELAKIVSQNIPTEIYATTTIDLNEYNHFDLIGKYITRISIMRLKSTSKSLWSSIEAGFVGVNTSDIQAIISAKSAKVGAYIKHCDRVWLVIVADGTHISSSVELDKAVVAHKFPSRFEKVLFYDVFSQLVHELPVVS